MTRLIGIVMIITGSVLWGVTGPMIEWLLGNTDMTVTFLLTIRSILAGAILLLIIQSRGTDVFAIWKVTTSRRQLVIFSLFGMLGLQYTFFATIEESNAIVATLLQFSAPIFIILFVSIKNKMWPPRYQVIGMTGTLLGLFFLLTNGSFGNLLVSSKALLLGLALGLAYTFYTLYPARLMKEWSVLLIVGWSMMVGGVGIGLMDRAWESPAWRIFVDIKLALMVGLLILFGTLAFVFFLNSMKYITAVETSILSSIEPLTAMIVSAIWFGTMLLELQLLGVFLMLIFVMWLSVGGNREIKQMEQARN